MIETVRPAVESDIPWLVQAGRDMVRESPTFSPLEYSAKKVTWYLYRALNDPRQLVLVYGEQEGLLVGGLVDFWFAEGTFATDYAIYVIPEKRGGRASQDLLNVFSDWARTNGALSVSIQTNTGVSPDGFKKVVEEIDFVPVGQTFVRGF